MSFIYNSNTLVKVNRISNNEVTSECTKLSNKLEMTAWIIIDTYTFAIKRAGWAIYCSPKDITGHFELPQLIGMTAYLNSGAQLKKLLGGEENETVRELIADCIRGIVQSEIFLLPERGYKNYTHYHGKWEQMYVDSCLYYSHLDTVPKVSMYEGDRNRTYNLFNRTKMVNITHEENGDYTVTASFTDCYHQLNIFLVLNPAGVVLESYGNFTRAHYNICFQNSHLLAKLKGFVLGQMTKKEIASLAGGSNGCDHMVSLLYETSRVLREALPL
ncbi:MAG: DUF2889 domain-containing protein [Syntrophomonadaceae bacterium]|jgi:hypothetical protein